MPQASGDLLQSFLEANASSRLLPSFSEIGVPVRRVGAAELAPLVSPGDPDAYWRAFYEAYPNSPGIIRLSRVGIGSGGTLALISVAHTCGTLCGSGRYLLLSKASGEWEVIDQWVVVVS
jgi:hypothetical protein